MVNVESVLDTLMINKNIFFFHFKETRVKQLAHFRVEIFTGPLSSLEPGLLLLPRVSGLYVNVSDTRVESEQTRVYVLSALIMWYVTITPGENSVSERRM